MDPRPSHRTHRKGRTSLSTFNAMRWVNKAPHEKAYEMQIDLGPLDEQVYPLTTYGGLEKLKVLLNEL